MNASIRKQIFGGAALLLVVTSALPVVALAKTAAVHKAVAHKAVAHKAAPKAAAANTHVKAIQKALDKSGAKLKVDGLMGKQTEAALKAFQSKHKLKVTGTADKATLKALKVK